MNKTILALVPHPDDAEYSAGGLLAKLARQGSRVFIVVATDGCRGSFETDQDTLIRLRLREALQAAKVLGAEQPIMLGYHDYELDKIPAGVLREQFVRIIRQVQPQVLVAQDPYGLDEPHPDHRQVAWAAYEAVNFSHLPLIYPEHIQQGLAPHLVVEKYFYGAAPARVNHIEDVTDTIDVKLAALAEHRTQVKFLVEGVFRQARAAGLDLSAMLGETASDVLGVFQMGLRLQAAEVGKQAGFSYGEAYRYERFGAQVDTLLELAGGVR